MTKESSVSRWTQQFSSQHDWSRATTHYFIISPPIQRFMWASELDYQGNFSKGSWLETLGRPYLIKVILFAHKFNKHTSTKYLPFFLLYNRNPPYQSTWNLNWSLVKKNTVTSLLIKKCLLLFFQLLSLWEKKCIWWKHSSCTSKTPMRLQSYSSRSY